MSAQQMQLHQQAILRLIELPGIGAEAAHQIIAEIGPTAGPSRPGAGWLPGLACVPGLTRARPKTIRAAAPKGIASCAACSAKPRKPACTRKGATCNPCSVG
jgi:transposase